MNAPLPPAKMDLSSARDKRMLIAGAVIGFGLALLAATFAGIGFLVPAPAIWQGALGIAVSGSVIYAGACAMPEDTEDDS